MPKPPRNSKLWRYIDLAKLIDLLERRVIFFPRADRFDDPWEGAIPEQTRRRRRQSFEQLQTDTEHLEEISEGLGERMKECTYISCWHESNVESAAMWKLYGDTIAIQTTYGRFDAELKKWPQHEISIGTVRYRDYARARFPQCARYPFEHKRLSFAHEREVRAIIQPVSDPEAMRSGLPVDGFGVPVDVERLVRRIVLRPNCESLVKKSVQVAPQDLQDQNPD